MLHAVRDCPEAKRVWLHLCPTPIQSEFFSETGLQNWIIHSLSSPKIDDNDDWLYFFPLTAWWLWKWRCQRVFRSSYNIPTNPVSYLNGKVIETKTALTKNNLLALIKMQKQEILIGWTPPPYEWMVLNTDGAAKGNPGEAGAGGIFRNHAGECSGFYSQNLGICSALHAEFCAILKGLQIAWEGGIRKLEVRVDNQTCVQILNHNKNYRGPSKLIVQQCKELINKTGWLIVLSHCYREANNAADWFSNHGVMQNEAVIMHHSPPNALARILHQDLLGVAWARKVAI